MNPGTQIAYVPDHAFGDLKHPDVEHGFVTSERGDVHFCRYWVKGQPGVLRTKANSEATPTRNLVQRKSVLDSEVRFMLVAIEANDNASPFFLEVPDLR